MQKEVPKTLLEILACPLCKGGLNYKKEKNKLICKECKQHYKIKNGVPVMLVPE